MTAWWVLAAAIVVEVAATLGLRASAATAARRRRRLLAAVVALYAVSFTLLWFALRLGMPVGVAYGVWAASGVALVAICARLLFDEPLTPTMTAGIALIAAGVIAIEVFAGVG